MVEAVVNGRRVVLPSNATGEDIRLAGGMGAGRTLIRRTREGNYVIPKGSPVPVRDGDVFTDAPRRIKG